MSKRSAMQTKVDAMIVDAEGQLRILQENLRRMEDVVAGVKSEINTLKKLKEGADGK